MNHLRHLPLLVLFALVMLSSAAHAAEPVAPQDSEDYRRGRLALQTQNWPLAIEHLDRAQAQFPDDPRILLGLAAAHQNAKHWLPAMAWYQAYLRLDLPAEDRRQAQDQLDKLDVAVRTMIDRLFAESVRLGDAAMAPNTVAKGAAASGDHTSAYAKSQSGPLKPIARMQASAGLLAQAEATMRLAEARHDIGVLSFDARGPRTLEALSCLALAETGNINPLLAARDKLAATPGGAAETTELVHLCYLYRFIMKRTPDVCAATARELARDPGLEHLEIEAHGALRQGDANPAHFALANVAAHASRALLRVRALSLEPWESNGMNPDLPDATWRFVETWLRSICDNPESRAIYKVRLVGESAYGGYLFASHLPAVARAFVLVDNNMGLTYQWRPGELWWPLLALVWRSDDPDARELADAFAAIGYGPLSRDSHGNTPLRTACNGANAVALKMLLDNRGGPAITGRDCDPLLLMAAGTGMDEAPVIEVLVAHKADVNCTDAQGNTPVHIAAGKDCNLMIEALSKHGAKLDAVNHAGKTPLQIATEKECQDAVATLQRLGARR